MMMMVCDDQGEMMVMMDGDDNGREGNVRLR